MSDLPNELTKLSAAELLDGYARKAFSPVEVCRQTLERIEALDGRLHAYLAIDAEGALAAAREAEKRWSSAGEKPLLCGVPVSVKDTIEMAGMPTTYGSRAFSSNQRGDAELVTRLRTSGAVILGKTNTPEFALQPRTENRLGPPTVNPWNLSRSAGGSSGGAAAAVAAGMGPLSIGTDSGGSVRLPAAYQGLFGLKPSHQRIPAVQDWRASPARSHNGPITRTVRDTALTMQALAGPDPRDPDSYTYPEADYLAFPKASVRGARVAVSRSLGGVVTASEEFDQILDEAIALLESLGCSIVEADPPSVPGDNFLSPGVWAYSGDHFAAAEKLCPNFLELHRDDLAHYSRPIYEAGQHALAWQYRKILERDRQYAQTVKRWFADFDFLLTPCCGAAPPNNISEVRDDKKGQFGFLAPFNLSRNPAAAVPWSFDKDGMPLAIQLVAPLGDDVRLLGLCGQIEGARPWAQYWPTLS
jgi:aspartyl-tRNA(Asn)/glutamyl-tRNA(Gln) amidotransferase subunit A